MKDEFKELTDAIVADAKRTAPDDEYGVTFLDADDRTLGWARVDRCGGFDVAVPMAIAQIREHSPEWKISRDDDVKAYLVTHHKSGEKKRIPRVLA